MHFCLKNHRWNFKCGKNVFDIVYVWFFLIHHGYLVAYIVWLGSLNFVRRLHFCHWSGPYFYLSIKIDTSTDRIHTAVPQSIVRAPSIGLPPAGFGYHRLSSAILENSTSNFLLRFTYYAFRCQLKRVPWNALYKRFIILKTVTRNQKYMKNRMSLQNFKTSEKIIFIHRNKL